MQTGESAARFFTTLRGEVAVADAPQVRARGPDVMFQRIIDDGLAGDAF